MDDYKNKSQRQPERKVLKACLMPLQNSGSDQKDTAKEVGSAAGNGMQIIGEKNGGDRDVVTIYSNGNRSEVWKKGDRQVEMNAGWKEPVISVVPSESFEDVSWISASNFSGLYKVHGQQCMVFRDHILPLVYRENPNLLKQPELPDGSHMNEADRKELEEYRKYLQQIAVDPETLKIDCPCLRGFAKSFADCAEDG